MTSGQAAVVGGALAVGSASAVCAAAVAGGAAVEGVCATLLAVGVSASAAGASLAWLATRAVPSEVDELLLPQAARMSSAAKPAIKSLGLTIFLTVIFNTPLLIRVGNYC